MPVKYLDPKTDLTFKKVFGEHEELLKKMYYYDRYWDALAKERSALSDFFDKGKAEGLKEGKAEGERQKAISIAKSLLASGIGIDIIASSTGLTADEIKKLQ